MKLDKRIENERLIYTPFTTTKPKLHEKGYFTDDIHDFCSLEDCDCIYGELIKHDGLDYPYPYCCESDDGCDDGSTTVDWYAFYIPESSIKSKEKQFRPCTLDEFGLNIGDLIKFRRKGDNDFEVCTMYMGYRKNGDVKVLLGECYYSLEELFSNYEWYDNDSDTWEPFGVEE